MSQDQDWRENKDWKISDAQYRMITDKISKLSKKEASLTIRFIQHVLLEGRPNQPNQNLPDNREQTVKLATEDTTGR